MESLLKGYASEYEASMEKNANNGEDHRSAFNPVVFLFVGDRTGDAIKAVKDEINKKWSNSGGILYFHVYSKDSFECEDTFGLKIDVQTENTKTYRKSLYGRFYSDEKLLIELNRSVRRLKSRLLEYGNTYSCFEKVNISVVTRSDDPLNVLIPGITMLFKSKLSEDFKMVSTDLYAMFTEKGDENNFGYTSAVSAAFFREMETFQDSGYTFRAPLEVLEEGIKLDIAGNGSLFDLVYLLSDRNEDGIIQDKPLERNYEIISYITLLKNRNNDVTCESEDNEVYNNEYFRRNISSDFKKQSYATAGLSSVKRPNYSIALTVLYHYCTLYVEKLKSNAEKDRIEILKMLRIDGPSLDRMVREMMPEGDITEEMTALMSSDLSLNQLEGLTYQEAEIRLYGDSSIRFFNENFEKRMLLGVEDTVSDDEVKAYIINDIVKNPKYGPYCAYLWTSQQSVMEDTGAICADIQNEIQSQKRQLADVYRERAALPSGRLLTGRKSALRNIKRDIIKKIYNLKLYITALNMKLKLVRKLEQSFIKFNEYYEKEIKILEYMESTIKELQKKGIASQDRYLGQNIDEYYRGVVRDINAELASTWGESFYFDERFMGQTSSGSEIINRLADNCKRYILSNKRFMESFEDELLHRANVSSEYTDRAVLTQDELFSNLYGILEKKARACIYIMNFAAKHRHEEKYFFGDCGSPFIQYAFKADAGSRTCKLGCINEKNASSIRKLNIMGGFTIDSVVYVRNCYKYYLKYKSEGYELHGMDEDKLVKFEF